MKSPEQLRRTLANHWSSGDRRACYLLGDTSAWPIELAIGRPTPAEVQDRIGEVRSHVQRWRSVGVGEVVMEGRSYRATEGAVAVPVLWRLRDAVEWVAAIGDRGIKAEYETLSRLLRESDEAFHEVLVRRRDLWKGRSIEDVQAAVRLAGEFEPGVAEGRPLRLLGEFGVDTKFFERCRALVVALLDQRFDGEPGRLGLEAFLGALDERDHWLLVIDLGGGLMPYRQLRVRASDLQTQALPGERVLLVENERCGHHLPAMPGTIAVLGSGANVAWTQAAWLSGRPLGYWGDIDTWGLLYLARVRQVQPAVIPLLMDAATFDAYSEGRAKAEPVVASQEPPEGLTAAEQQLYRRLLQSPCGRLEQEHLDRDRVHRVLTAWLENL